MKSETISSLSQNFLTKDPLSIQTEKEQVHQKPTTAHLKLNLKECIQRKNNIQKVSAEDTISTNNKKFEGLNQILSPKVEIFFNSTKYMMVSFGVGTKSTKYKPKITLCLASKQILNKRMNERHQSQWKMS